MDISFVKFLVKLAEVTEGKITARVKQLSGYTLKHWGGRQPQEPHGWRYGANILRPNGMGKASIERGRAYLGRVTDRDLDSKLTGKRVASGAANNRGINNYHMEYQKRSRGGDSKLRRWDKGERDREYGNSLSDQKGLGTGRSGKTSAVGKNTPSNEGKGQKWVKHSAKLIDPNKSYWDLTNRVHGGKGKSNPWTKQQSVQARRDEARQKIRGVRKSPIARSENPKVLARQISETGGRLRKTPGSLFGRGGTNKRTSVTSARIRNADAIKKAPRVKTEAQRERDKLAKVRARAAATAAGQSKGKITWWRRKKELNTVNPILGRLMNEVYARVEGVLLEKHKELYVPDEHTSPYRELITYKAKSNVSNYMRGESEKTASKEIELRESSGNTAYPFRFAFQKFASTEKERRGLFGIHIDPENKGKFTATKKRTGKSTEELTQSHNPLTKKRAVFAKNALRWGK